ncbi:DUF7619 domain-containing protein [Tenacibaculum ovolyticum]|uniref:DUF7619 domain-containing protein n=1 Tax=Tenacibaculum ovolyticum TaxID=104270 RepID=UPI001F2B63DB|nr:T9SS type A sorting domain-containing protein [Tenacibaculum ovolyticum]
MKKLLLITLLIGYFTIVNAQKIDFLDSNFENALLNHIPKVDTDSNGEISIQEAEAVTSLNLDNKRISNLSSIEAFVNLETLQAHNNRLRSINLSSNVKLKTLSLYRNFLTDISLVNNIDLTKVTLISNSLTSINVSNNLNLKELALSYNEISEIDISNNIELLALNMFDTNLTQIDVSNNTKLSTLSLPNNNLTEIDVSNNPDLKSLNLTNSTLTEIDVSNNSKLMFLYLNSNDISAIDVRSCAIQNIDFSNNPNLKRVFMTGQPLYAFSGTLASANRLILNDCPQLEFICADDQYLTAISDLLIAANQESCTFTSDCTLFKENRIQGTVTYDANNDGCDSTDLPFTGGVKISAISLTGAPPIFVYPNEQGLYNLFLADDTYFIGPSLQNLNYYTFSTPIIPAPINIPAQLNTLITDYCVKSIGNFNDLEITFVPVSRARPGFNATYLLTYKNIGTTTQSGNITVDYQEDVLNYVSSVPTVNSNTGGQLTWSFTNLLPMQTVEVPVTFTLNTPTDSPALNNGDILNYTATVTGATDETPDNNVMELAQTVVNSYDPNDKTCLEGNILKPDNVGNYLHYLIRFENKGTAEAVNIRVKDVIDTTKLDIESLIPLKSSHSYSTTITNGNEVEFTFNNINLPFDDANNDGYVLFKIKSKATLVEGDKIVNGAAIYFDFNAPVITEDEIVTVKKEVIEQPKFSDYFTLSPNPTTGILNLTVLDESIQISYITIYDIGGNLVGYYLGTTRTMDVSYLYPNNYFMKIITNKGEQVTQFIKL